VVSVPSTPSGTSAPAQPTSPTFPTGQYWDQNYYDAQVKAGNTAGAQKYIDYVTNLNKAAGI
jgi:hypothetical protein